MKNLVINLFHIVLLHIILMGCASYNDPIAPVIAEVTAVTTPTNDSTPNYTFSSDDEGTITYGGSCSSSTTSATSGNNTITLVSLNEGTYSNCTISVTDAKGNVSNSLTITSFTLDSTAPTLVEVTAVTDPTNDSTPDYTFSSDEAGTITFGGSCSSSITSATSDNNTITFISLIDGTYSDCTIKVTDSAGNESIILPITTFTCYGCLSFSSSATTSVAFGQSYQYQLTTSGTYSGGTITYSLSNEPDNMTISSSGLVEWTPNLASQITTHSNITITLTTASGYVLTQAYDLTVTGTCVSGNVLAFWTGDQRSSTDSSKFLGNITAYTDNATSGDICGQSNNQDCTPAYNYDYNTVNNVSENLHIGPVPSATKGNMFFYNQYDNSSHVYLFWMFGEGSAAFSNPAINSVHLDIFTANNTSSDNVTVTDDSEFSETQELHLESQDNCSGSNYYCSIYTGRFGYGSLKSDGGVIGPFTGNNYRIMVDLGGKSPLTSSHDTSAEVVNNSISYDLNFLASGVSGYDLGLGNLDSFKFWSKDGSSFSLGDVDNFTVGYKTTIDCSN
jgi:hypothetical protein